MIKNFDENKKSLGPSGISIKDVAVVIINYNTSKYTLECVRTVLQITSKETSYQMVVVDNSSTIEDYKNLKVNFPSDTRCKLVRSGFNTGFGGGNITGVKASLPARYLLFLNNDCLLLNDCLTILTEFMDSHPRVGVCTAQNFDEHGNLVPSFDHNKGLRRLLFGRGFLEWINPKRYPNRKKAYKEPVTVDWVNGAFLFFRREAYEQIGGFDPNIFLYWEELDLCNRLRKNGLRSVLVPGARVLHYQGVSIGQSPDISKESYRSYLYVIRKKDGYLKYLITKIYLWIVFLLKPKKRYLITVLKDRDPMTHSIAKRSK